MSYYYAGATATERMGPCNIEHLIQQYKLDLINDQTLVWTEGQVNWEPLQSNKIGPIVMETSKQFVEYDVDNDDEEDDDDNLSLSNEENRLTEVMACQSILNKVFSEDSDQVSVDAPDNYEEGCLKGSPPLMKGQLLKMASGLIKNWRNRFFILEKGTLIYCEPTHLKLRGRYNLEGLLVMGREDAPSCDSPETIRMYSSTRPDICLIAASIQLRKRWVDAIEMHIKYANSLADSKRQPQQTSGSSPTTLTKHSSVRKMTVIEQGDDGLAFRRDEVRDSVCGGDQARMSKRSDAILSVRAAPSPKNAVERSNTTISSSSSILQSATIDTNSNTRMNSASSIPANLTDGDLVRSGATVFGVRPSNASGRSSSMNEIPIVCEGWLQKQGAIFPSIRRRFFILDRGVMKYYRSNIHDNADPRNNSVYSHTPLGLVTITNYELFSDNSESIQLVLVPGPKSLSKRKLVIYCENFSERDVWVTAINAHIAYNSAAVAAVVSAKSNK